MAGNKLSVLFEFGTSALSTREKPSNFEALADEAEVAQCPTSIKGSNGKEPDVITQLSRYVECLCARVL